jgi:hypothetical protein
MIHRPNIPHTISVVQKQQHMTVEPNNEEHYLLECEAIQSGKSKLIPYLLHIHYHENLKSNQTMFTFRSINLMATNRHEINIKTVDINMHLAYCLGCICVKKDVPGLA